MYTVIIKKKNTGEVRHYNMDLEWGDSSYSWWTNGNMGCDCNRSLCFQRAAGEEEKECACTEGAYIVPLIILKDGRKIVIDKHYSDARN